MEKSLKELGAELKDVVRTRAFVTDIRYCFKRKREGETEFEKSEKKKSGGGGVENLSMAKIYKKKRKRI